HLDLADVEGGSLGIADLRGLPAQVVGDHRARKLRIGHHAVLHRVAEIDQPAHPTDTSVSQLRDLALFFPRRHATSLSDGPAGTQDRAPPGSRKKIKGFRVALRRRNPLTWCAREDSNP